MRVGALSPAALIGLVSTAEILSLVGYASYAALLPELAAEWNLTNTEAGWINGISFGTYAVAVPFLLTLTDRIEARTVYLWSLAATTLAYLGFAVLADGFWSALAFRALTGVALAGTYMPGMKLLVDRTEGAAQARAVNLYLTAFGVGSALSYWVSGLMAAAHGWRAAFGLAAAAPCLALIIVAIGLASATTPRAGTERARLFDFRPVVRSRIVVAYMLAYAVHLFELFGLRTWTVAFLVFAHSRHHGGDIGVSITFLATLVSLLGIGGIVAGGEFGVRFGRQRVLCWAMALSSLMAMGIGFAAALPFWVLVALLCLWGIVVNFDASVISAGAVANAPPGYRGVTMGLHTSIGFIGGFLGPLAVGAVLDRAGGTDSLVAWGFGFAALGVIVAIAPIAVTILGRGEIENPPPADPRR